MIERPNPVTGEPERFYKCEECAHFKVCRFKDRRREEYDQPCWDDFMEAA
jgi:hypothetical protein